MATVRDIVNHALQRSSIAGKGEVPDDEDFAAGLLALNVMLHGWELSDIPQILTEDLTGEDTFPLPDSFRNGVSYLLASHLATEYRIPPAFDPDRFMRLIRNYYLELDRAAGNLTAEPSDAYDYLPSNMQYSGFDGGG